MSLLCCVRCEELDEGQRVLLDVGGESVGGEGDHRLVPAIVVVVMPTVTVPVVAVAAHRGQETAQEAEEKEGGLHGERG